MQNNELKQYAAGETNFNGSDLSETSLSEAPLSKAPLSGLKISNGLVLLVAICFFIMAYSVAFPRLTGLWKAIRNRKAIIKRSEQIPCSNCRFFENNLYLKCAVHPYTVLSEKAIDCSDYWPRDGNFLY